MANGESWQDWMNKGAIACPFAIEFEKEIYFNDEKYICKDRGSNIVFDGEYYWIDVLTDSPKYFFGEIFDAILLD